MPSPGWAKPDRARVWHWIDWLDSDGLSLCGRWRDDGWLRTYADHEHVGCYARCRVCERRRADQRVAEAERLELTLAELEALRSEVEARGRLLDSYEVRLAAYRSRALAVGPGVEREPPLWWLASPAAWSELVPLDWGWDREPVAMELAS